MIYISSDHAGFELKNQLVEHIKSVGGEVTDVGPHVYDKQDDYPDFIYPCAEMVAKGGPEDRGVVLGYSGQGEAMVANKVKGIRATVYYGGNTDIIKLSREHNGANVLSLGAGFVSLDEAKQVLDLWLSIPLTSHPDAAALKTHARC